MDVIVDGVRIFCLLVGSSENPPLFLLHGGPGFDHTEMHPWLDALSDTFYLLYIDLRGHGRSQRVDPATATLDVFANDITAMASEMGLESYAVLGHSFGSFVALTHAVKQGTATHYIVSGGTASFSKSGPEIQANIDAFQPVELREQIRQSWAEEASVRTPDDVRRLWLMQMPFHFATSDSDAYREALRDAENNPDTILTPEMLAYAAAHEYAIEYEDQLASIQRPVLVIAGEQDRVCTPRAQRDMGVIPHSEVVIVPDAGHMSFVEQPEEYMTAVRNFYNRNR